jgi:Tfp pilus assembly protein PilF
MIRRIWCVVVLTFALVWPANIYAFGWGYTSSKLLFLVPTGCVMPPRAADPRALTSQPYGPLVNGKLVTIEIVSVNGQAPAGQSVEKAIATFSRYLAGKVQTVQGEPVIIETGKNSLPTQSQLDEVIASRRYQGPCDITIYITPGVANDAGIRGRCSLTPDGSHTVVLQGRKIDAMFGPFREMAWQLVATHELCHALDTPADRSHTVIVGGRHCTHPECILYQTEDTRAWLTGIMQLGPPMGLCAACRAEVLHAQQATGGKLVNPDEAFDLEDWQESVAQINSSNQALASNAADADAYYDRAAAYYIMGLYASAIADYTRLIELRPGNPDAYRWRGEAYWTCGRIDDAFRDLGKALELQPNDPEVCNSLAWYYVIAGDATHLDPAEARKIALKAVELVPAEADYYDTLACVYAAVGDFAKAVETEQKTIELSNDSEEKAEFIKRLEGFNQHKNYLEQQREQTPSTEAAP